MDTIKEMFHSIFLTRGDQRLTWSHHSNIIKHPHVDVQNTINITCLDEFTISWCTNVVLSDLLERNEMVSNDCGTFYTLCLKINPHMFMFQDFLGQMECSLGEVVSAGRLKRALK